MSSAVSHVVAAPPSPVKSMTSFTSDETSELLAEVDDLKADTQYVDFVEAVVTGKDLEDESDEVDPLFKADPLGQPCSAVGENGDSSKAADEASSSSEDEEDSDVEDDVPAEEVSAVTANSEDPIPIRMKAEASKRFPPFWKTQMKLQASEANGDHEDEDYSPAAMREAEATECSESDSSDDDSEADMDDEDVESADPLADTEVMKALKSGLDEMQLVEAEVEKEAKMMGQEKNLLNAISSFDDSTYDETADGEYVQPKDVDETIEAQEEEDERKLQQHEEELSSESEGEDGEDMEV